MLYSLVQPVLAIHVLCVPVCCRDAIPSYWVWMYYISLLRFPLSLFLWNEFDMGLGDQCFSTYDVSAAVGFTVADPQQACGFTGMSYIAAKGLALSSPWINIGIMVACAVAFRVAFWYLLHRWSTRTRP